MASGLLPVGTCSHSVSINQHEPLVNFTRNARSGSHVISCAGYSSHLHLLQRIRDMFWGFFFGMLMLCTQSHSCLKRTSYIPEGHPGER